jgi:hypothetical protein
MQVFERDDEGSFAREYLEEPADGPERLTRRLRSFGEPVIDWTTRVSPMAQRTRVIRLFSAYRSTPLAGSVLA